MGTDASSHRRALGALAVPVLLAVALLLVLAPAAPAQQQDRERVAGDAVLLVLDASGSMRGDDGTGRPKIDAAKAAVTALAIDLPDSVEVGLRIYGHRTSSADREAGCRDTELVVPVGPLDRERLVAAVEAVEPSGYTPLGLSLAEAAGDLGDRAGTIVLVSDGLDTCAPPDPCEVAQSIAGENLDVRVETVGFQADEAAQAQLQCIADAGAGEFRSVDDADELVEALRAYVVGGERIRGGDDPADAPLLEPGRYRDEVGLGVTRWYAIEPGPGQAVRAEATLVPPASGVRSEDAELSLELRRGDLIGDLRCATDTIRGIGGELAVLTVEGPVIDPEQGQCASPERYLLRVALVDTRRNQQEPDPLEGEVLDLELVVDLVGAAEPVVTETPASPRPRPLPPAEPPATPERTPMGIRVGAIALLGIAGYGAGAVVARRTGP